MKLITENTDFYVAMFAYVLTGYERLWWCPSKPLDPRYAPAYNV